MLADISGFTPLTETLVEEFGPARGAEELTGYLNKVYEALIAEVHRHRGSVIGFSGDAITCWFGDDNGLKSVACALVLQQVMGRFAKAETPAGTSVSLTIREVVTAGEARRFRVGDPAIQYMDVLAGAMMDRVAEAEKQAGKGEIILDAETADRLADSVTVEWRRKIDTGPRVAIVIGITGPVAATPWPDLPPRVEEEQIRPWLLPPVYERLKTGQGRLLAELRPAVSLFLKFGGLDYDQDDAAGERLDAYIRWVQNVLARYEGYLIQITTSDKGSYLYAVFGAPLAHDDDAARAVAAALDLRTPPSDLDFITGVQIGVSQGRTWAGIYGGSGRCTYGVLGDEVNVAARLMERAEPGQVLVSQRVARATAGRYRFQSLGLVKVRGKKGPVPVFTVLSRQLPSGPADLFAAPLIERETERAQLEKALGSVLAGRGQILRVEGEAGIGKSRLAAELVRRAANCNFRVAIGACQSTMRGVA
ncbi:MAG: adenylate/guanylate cyclase domain-containing protein, partial [Anaerolineae bacterium]|nr:adenylate/guanylate cyclase domain-containing protein [Anaerolineae bacterium]